MSKLVVKIYETELSVYLNNNNKQTLIQTGKENLVDIVYKIAIELGLYDNNNIQQIKLSDLWQIARESDDYLTDPYIAVNGDTSEFEIYDTIKPHLQKLLADRN
ncbi:MAG: hypothetical protein NZZ41_06110, partial [Candidatus Dojkabacteria bacterium]|nr:hypothetical protein [Candidatus Dojkabacteria bacterium]